MTHQYTTDYTSTRTERFARGACPPTATCNRPGHAAACGPIKHQILISTQRVLHITSSATLHPAEREIQIYASEAGLMPFVHSRASCRGGLSEPYRTLGSGAAPTWIAHVKGYGAHVMRTATESDGCGHCGRASCLCFATPRLMQIILESNVSAPSRRDISIQLKSRFHGDRHLRRV